MKRYKHLKEKEIRYNLHGSTLSEYYRASRIPRGLRIQKAPTIGRGDLDFCKKWTEIMNKASLDLTLLVVEFTQKELLKIKDNIEDVKASIVESHDETVLTQQTELLDASLTKYKQDLQQIKIRKFRRDTIDYRDDKVYPWINLPTTFRPRRRVHFEDGAALTSASSMDSDFLGGISSDTDTSQSTTSYPTRRRGGVDEAPRPSQAKPTPKRQSRKKKA
ncbi:uncharacterized protein LOC134464529 [Engraulis encrasicolus]|uniref:uncharacterized protein LOC134464529 n=1 Tax=Engraulis encrasicolus TaxID=184585 RepID=UPI002FD4C2FD